MFRAEHICGGLTQDRPITSRLAPGVGEGSLRSSSTVNFRSNVRVNLERHTERSWMDDLCHDLTVISDQPSCLSLTFELPADKKRLCNNTKELSCCVFLL